MQPLASERRDESPVRPLQRSQFLGIAVRHEHVALLSMAGSIVCVSGAWLMRRAKTFEGARVLEHSRTCAQVTSKLSSVAN